MKTLGLKLTHDAAACLIQDGKLEWSVELEKINNGPRYAKLHSWAQTKGFLRRLEEEEGLDYSEAQISVDGWKRGRIKRLDLLAAGYGDEESPEKWTEAVKINFLETPASSYTHAYNHIVSAVCTSPFPEEATCHVLVWDGSQTPRLYFCDPRAQKPSDKIRFVGKGLEFYAHIYGIAGHYFGPYSNAAFPNSYDSLWGRMDWPGKLMSYMSAGLVNKELLLLMEDVYEELLRDKNLHSAKARAEDVTALEHSFLQRLKPLITPRFGDATALYNLHLFLQKKLLTFLKTNVIGGKRLCFVGGAALNIKWNAEFRRHFDLWVPPFPNDSGSAIGAACSAHFDKPLSNRLSWSVYSGPKFDFSGASRLGWEAKKCSPEQLAVLFVKRPRVIVGTAIRRAEIGPRALGHRSLLCCATIEANRRLLNDVKAREHFRPVAPICPEEFAQEYFSPGTPDPYMLYEHAVLADAAGKIPAVTHVDGSARLQTVNARDAPEIHALLRALESLTGVGVLCNTSANFNGSGFFSDFVSYAELDYLEYIWDGRTLYSRPGSEGGLV